MKSIANFLTAKNQRAITTLACLSAFFLSSNSPAATITVSLNPAGPVSVGQQFDVNLAITGWNAADGEVDSVAFFVDFDPTLFSYVPGSGSVSSGAAQFLEEGSQDLANYTPSNDSTDAGVAFGRYGFGISDVDVGGGLAGSIGGGDGAGGLGAFTLEAIAPGTRSITAGANNVGEVFLDTGLFGISPTGGVTFGSQQMTVVPEPSAVLLAGSGLIVFSMMRRRRKKLNA